MDMNDGSAPPSGDGYPADFANGRADGVPDPSDEITLQEIASMLWGGKWVILATFVAILALGGTYTFLQLPTYETSSLILVEGKEGGVSSIFGEGESGVSPLVSGQSNLANEILIAEQSETISRSVARRLDSVETNPYTGDDFEVLTGPEGERRTTPEIAKTLRGEGGEMTMSVSAAGGNLGGQYESADALQISVKGISASEAAYIANAYSEAYMDYKLRKSQESARSARQFLEKQVARFRNRVAQSEKRLKTFMQEEDAVALDQETERIIEQIASMEARRDELQIQLEMTRSALQSKEEELNRIRPNLAERISSSLGKELSQVQRKKAEVSSEISAIKRRQPDLDPEDPNTERARNLAKLLKREEALEAEADSLSSLYVEETIAAGGVGSIPAGEEGGGGSGRRGRGLDYVVELQQELAQQRIEAGGLQAQLNTVQNRLAEYEQELGELPEQSLQLARLQRERRSREKIFQFVQEQLQETRMAEESEVGSTELIQSAAVPEKPISPNTRLNLVLAAFLGLLGGTGLVFLREALDTKIRAPEDLEDLGPKLLGTIPNIKQLMEEELGGPGPIEIDGRSVESELVMLTAPMSAPAEAYRRLRENLRFARPDAGVRTLMVTSADKGEGKTTTSLNLALAVASSGQQTLLVDMDLRLPRIHKYFNKSQSPGLTESLYDESIVDEEGIMSTQIDNFSMLTAGGEAPNPSELLGSRRTGDFLHQMEERFDLIILDTPPLLPFSDPLSVVTHTDGALLVAESGTTDAPSFRKALSLLRDVNASPLGAVLNKFDPKQARSYGYSYGGYGYAYEYQSVEDYYKEEPEDGFFSFLRS